MSSSMGSFTACRRRGHVHGRVAARFTAKLFPFVEEHELGEVYAAETGFLLARNPDSVRPGCGVRGGRRLAELPPAGEGFFPGPPDLAVEVVSPSESYGDVEAKVRLWLSAGTLAVVVLDPRRASATVCRPEGEVVFLSAEDTLTLNELIPGWSLRLADVFR